MRGQCQYRDVEQKEKRERKDSGFNELSPEAKFGSVNVFFDERTSLSRPNTLHEEEEEDEEEGASQRFKVFFEGGKQYGRQRIIVEDTSTHSSNRYRSFVEEGSNQMKETQLLVGHATEAEKININMGTTMELSTENMPPSSSESSTGLIQQNPAEPHLTGEGEEQSINRILSNKTTLIVATVSLFILVAIGGVVLALRAPQDAMTYGDMKNTTKVKMFIFPNCSPSCQRLYSNISIPNGSFYCKEDRLWVNCHRYYKTLYEDPSIDCNSLKVDKQFLSCTKQVCNVLRKPKYGQISCNESTAIGSSCTVTCDHGLSSGESPNMKCQEDKTWSRVPSCLPPPCYRPDNSTGDLICSETGLHCLARCVGANKKFVGLTQISSCRGDLCWDKNPNDTMCEQSCSLPHVSDGHIICGDPELTSLFQQAGIPHGTRCQLSCNAGFRATPPSESTCLSSWSPALGRCEETVLVLVEPDARSLG